MNMMVLIALALMQQGPEGQQVLNDEWSISSGSRQTFTLTLMAPSIVEIDIQGVKHASKGFRVKLSEGGTEITRKLIRTEHWGAGDHVIEVKNSENLLEHIAVHVMVTVHPDPEAVAATPAPQGVGTCTRTTVARLGTRLEDSHRKPVPGSGTAISFANGIGLVSYDTVPGAEEAKLGDVVTLCLIAIPDDCPAGDERGRTYSVTIQRTKKKFSMSNSTHSCGGA